jgi:GPH family glycoside/pentoside/hexuronide:cation symporter
MVVHVNLADANEAGPGRAAAPESRLVSLPIKLAYGFGSLAYGIKDNGFSTLLLLFYNQVVGLPASLVGLAILIALVLDAFIDPVVGHLSDHLHSRWGRRHPFMYASAIPVGGLYLLLWNPPVGASHGVVMLYLIVVAILVRTAISCYEVPSSALAPELTSDYHERTSVLGYRYLFGWIGGIGMLLLTFAVFLAPTVQYPVGQLNPAGYRTYAIAAASLMVAAILISALGTHREIARLPRVPLARTSVIGTFQSIRRAFENRAFSILLLAGMFSYTNQGLNFALNTYFNTFLWGFPASALAVFTVCVMLGVVLALGLAGRASRRWGKRRAAVWTSAGNTAAATAPLLLRFLGWFPANGDPALFPLLMADVVLVVTLGVTVAILGSSMMSDVIEDAQSRTGKRQEGLFFAGSFFMQKCVSGLGLFLSGAILSLVRFPAAAVPGTVPGDVLDRLILLYCALTAVIGVAAAIVLSRFPLGQADHEQRLAQLAEIAMHASPLPGSEAEMPAEPM